MDGNNSLKRVAVSGTRTVGDTRTFTSDYFIPQAEVNRFAGEVKARQAQPHVEVPRANRLNPDPEDGDHSDDDAASDGDPTDGAPDSACASNWKAAASNEKKIVVSGGLWLTDQRVRSNPRLGSRDASAEIYTFICS